MGMKVHNVDISFGVRFFRFAVYRYVGYSLFRNLYDIFLFFRIIENMHQYLVMQFIRNALKKAHNL